MLYASMHPEFYKTCKYFVHWFYFHLSFQDFFNMWQKEEYRHAKTLLWLFSISHIIIVSLYLCTQINKNSELGKKRGPYQQGRVRSGTFKKIYLLTIIVTLGPLGTYNHLWLNFNLQNYSLIFYFLANFSSFGYYSKVVANWNQILHKLSWKQDLYIPLIVG